MDIIQQELCPKSTLKYRYFFQILEFLEITTLLKTMNINKEIRKKLQESVFNYGILKVILYITPLLKDLKTFKRLIQEEDKFIKEIRRVYPEIYNGTIIKALSMSFQLILETRYFYKSKKIIQFLENQINQTPTFYNILPDKYKKLFRYVVNDSSRVNKSSLEYLKNFHRLKISNFSFRDQLTCFIINNIERKDLQINDLEIIQNFDSCLDLPTLFNFLNKQSNYLDRFSISFNNEQEINVENIVNLIEVNSKSLKEVVLDVNNIYGIHRVIEALSKCVSLKKIKFSHSCFNEKALQLESQIVHRLIEFTNLQEINLTLEYPENIIKFSNLKNTNFSVIALPQIYPKEIYSLYINNYKLRKICIKTIDLLYLQDMIYPLIGSIKNYTNLESVYIEINQMDDHFDIYKKLIISLYDTRIKKLVINPINKTIKKKLIDEVIFLLRRNIFIKNVRFKKEEYNIYLENICKFSVSRIINEMLEVMLILYERNLGKKCRLRIKYFMDNDYENCIFKYSATWKNYPSIMRLIDGIEILGINEENFPDFLEFLRECSNLRHFSFYADISEESWNQLISVMKSLKNIEKLKFNYNENCNEALTELISCISKKNLQFLDFSHNVFTKSLENYLINNSFPNIRIIKISNFNDTIDEKGLSQFLSKVFMLNFQLLSLVVNGKIYERE